MMMSEFTIQHEAQRALGGGAADALGLLTATARLIRR